MNDTYLNYIAFEELATQDMSEAANIKKSQELGPYGPSHAMRTTEGDDFSQLFDHLVQDLLSLVLRTFKGLMDLVLNQSERSIPNTPWLTNLAIENGVLHCFL